MLPFASAFKWLREDALRITQQRVVAVFLAVLCCAVYGPFLANPFLFDDHNLFGKLDFINYTFQFSLSPRWLPYASLAHTHVLLDGSTTAQRLGNLFIHATNVVLVFVLLREICRASLAPGESSQRDTQALVVAVTAAALFAVHPVAVYAVGYIAQRTILMSTLFTLAMMIAYLRWLTTGRHSLWIWSALWYFLAVFSKEHSVAAPVAAFLLTFLVLRPSASLFRRCSAPFAAYIAIALIVVSMVKGVLGAAYEPYAPDMIKEVQGANATVALTYPLSVVTQIYLFFKYLYLWVFPNVNWMSLDMREELAPALLAWPYVGAILGIVCYLIAALAMLLRRGRLGVAGWILLYPLVMFATELSTIRIQEPFVLYRAYLWFPLFGALVPLVLIPWNAKRTLLFAVPVLCVLVGLSWNRLHSMSDGLLVWEDAAKLLVSGKEPGAGRIYYNRALALVAKRRSEEALPDLDRAISLNPNLAPVYVARANARFDLKRFEEALQDLNTAISLDSKQSPVYFARSVTLKKLGRDDQAAADMELSCEMKNFMACYALKQAPQTSGK